MHKRYWRIISLSALLLLALPLLAAGETGTPSNYLPLAGLGMQPAVPPILLSALYYDTYVTGEPDEAFQLYNPASAPMALGGWRVTAGTRTVTFPAGIVLGPGIYLWCTRDAGAFARTFGHPPDCAYGATAPGIPTLTGTALQLANDGGRVTLANPNGTYTDVLVYEGGSTATPGWAGPAVYPYRPSTSFAAEGQILYRKLDQQSGRPVPDTGTRADWAADPSDLVDGRKARRPGWDLQALFAPARYEGPARVEVIVAPDHAFEALATHIGAAAQGIRFEGYTFESAPLASLLAAKAAGGVQVELLLEAGPVGGVTDLQRWCVARVANAGGVVRYLRSSPALGVRSRFANQHGKAWLFDGSFALVGSENPGSESMPDDAKGDGTLGRRGVYVGTDAPAIVERLSVVMDRDAAAPEVWAWQAGDPTLGAPPPGYLPDPLSGGTVYPVHFPQPLAVDGEVALELFVAPEGAMRTVDGLLGLLARAGAGDTVLVEQLYEHTWWGAAASSVADDPNPRLDAYVAAARRGAKVRILLDSLFDDLGSPRSNLRTVEYLTAIARAEGLDLQAQRGNPTGLGLHNKLVLVHAGGRGWAVAGSLNGGEVSAKLNREIGLIAGSDAVYSYLAEVFWSDWGERVK